jgi:DNA-binding CsgD family transcriptional regulator
MHQKSDQEVADRKIERDRRICALRANGLTFDALARRFGLSRERVRIIVRQNEQRIARNVRVRAKFDGVFHKYFFGTKSGR